LGQLIYETTAGFAPAAIGTLAFSSDPWDPGIGLLTVSEGSWSFALDGLDSTGAEIPNGVYIVEASSVNGAQSYTQTSQVTLIRGDPVNITGLNAAPNPVLPGNLAIFIWWNPVPVVDVQIYNNAGELVRTLMRGSARSSAWWDMKDSGGATVANGIYLVYARVPGQRRGAAFKVAISR
jgi:hypothetical protein